MWEQVAVVVGSIMIISSWLPQIIRLVKLKSSEDISLTFLLVIAVGTLLLVPHSIVIEDSFFIILNTTAGGVGAVTLLIAWYYRNNLSLIRR